jgi:hypothetical protein
MTVTRNSASSTKAVIVERVRGVRGAAGAGGERVAAG